MIRRRRQHVSLWNSPPHHFIRSKKYRYGRRATSTANQQSQTARVNRLRFFWTRIWGKTCVWKRS
ncbi:MAG: hypothetical protein VB143_09055 [Burkholderia sp.]